MKLSYNPSINKFSITETDTPFINVSYPDARLWLRGDGLPRRRIRELLQIAYVLGHLGESLIIR